MSSLTLTVLALSLSLLTLAAAGIIYRLGYAHGYQAGLHQ